MDSPSESPRQSAARRPFPVDFPLSFSVADIQNLQRSFGEFLESVENTGDLELPMEGMESNGDLELQTSVGGSGSETIEEALNPASPVDEQQHSVQPEGHPLRRRDKEVKKPVVTLATVLEPTTYKETEDKDQRSIGYIGAQITACRFLQKHAADELTTSIAHQFTRYIDPELRLPSWKEALRFCYWLRTQGFDTYARIEHDAIILYIAKPKTHDRTQDRIYWAQHMCTGYIVDQRFLSRWDPRYCTHNALASSADYFLARGMNPPGIPDHVDLVSLLRLTGAPPVQTLDTGELPHLLPPAGFP